MLRFVPKVRSTTQPSHFRSQSCPLTPGGITKKIKRGKQKKKRGKKTKDACISMCLESNACSANAVWSRQVLAIKMKIKWDDDNVDAIAKRSRHYDALCSNTRSAQSPKLHQENTFKRGYLIASQPHTSDGGTPKHSSGTPCCSISSSDTDGT